MNIAIIGAGLAGLTAANLLQAKGAKVRVFEKSRGVGGRLANKRLPWASLDLGAQYFTARDPRFRTREDGQTRYVGVPAMNSPAHELAENLDVRLNSRVERLLVANGQWHVVTGNDSTGDEARFDRVIVCLPASQSKALLHEYEIASRIPTEVHQACWALALATRGHVESDIKGFFGDDFVSWVSRLSSRPMRDSSPHWDDLWMLHFAGDWSEIQGKNTALDLVESGSQWLNRALSGYCLRPLTVVEHYSHFWRFARVIGQPLAQACIVDSDIGLAVAGDWVAGGRVEGAYLSGLAAAEQILTGL
ncbi:NAD(P)/FAD-dependent oxidoreductase [Teredinibacter turnerae]|uniref:NAD(P)/FAD-dependent oxidoreductase n=1 Tax=Teredinibacter turnerae TaxID=2426 RepID=UPI00037E689D|nr:FAD-dependent oxidoreductase [Teredinibacter turnerae]